MIEYADLETVRLVCPWPWRLSTLGWKTTTFLKSPAIISQYSRRRWRRPMLVAAVNNIPMWWPIRTVIRAVESDLTIDSFLLTAWSPGQKKASPKYKRRALTFTFPCRKYTLVAVVIRYWNRITPTQSIFVITPSYACFLRILIHCCSRLQR